MSVIVVTPAQLEQLSARTTGSASAIATELAALRAGLAPLGSDWAGQAATAFAGLFEQWRRSADSLQQALEGIARLLGQAGGAYADADARIAASFTA